MKSIQMMFSVLFFWNSTPKCTITSTSPLFEIPFQGYDGPMPEGEAQYDEEMYHDELSE